MTDKTSTAPVKWRFDPAVIDYDQYRERLRSMKAVRSDGGVDDNILADMMILLNDIERGKHLPTPDVVGGDVVAFRWLFDGGHNSQWMDGKPDQDLIELARRQGRGTEYAYAAPRVQGDVDVRRVAEALAENGWASGGDFDDEFLPDVRAAISVALAAQPKGDAHPDDVAVDAFAVALKAKLAEARAKGRGGWNGDEPGMQQRLSDMLRAHVEKGDPRDVANFAMFLHQRGEAILPAEQATGDDLVRYCPECSSTGDVPPGDRDCCPYGSAARLIPRHIAHAAHRDFHQSLQAHPAEQTRGEPEWPLHGRVYERRGEWVMELEGVIDDVAMIVRHTEPMTTARADVPSLPHLYPEIPDSTAEQAVADGVTFDDLEELAKAIERGGEAVRHLGRMGKLAAGVRADVAASIRALVEIPRATPRQAVPDGLNDPDNPWRRAVEHAGYFVDAVSSYLKSSADASIEGEQVDGLKDPSDEQLDRLHSAQTTADEYRNVMRALGYEFTKRRDRALATLAAPSAGRMGVDRG
ncbi:MAG: hypothetical protein GAK28_03182 [Luteibacter sp.]|uniref:hypothetical protein n=1 Tax=Luteibacter sp. TaxID=1886636 RepID=UPI00137D94C5|nr:hypothetical protein [Luteibacter sp.]KAF1005430.1 MAG: hypothetical protein GAK28_03182 [Luteibacter sp.]